MRDTLPEILFQPPEIKPAEHFEFLEKIGGRHGLSRQRIRMVQEAYALAVPKTRLWVSALGETPGFRRIAMLTMRGDRAFLYAVGETGAFLSLEKQEGDIWKRPFGDLLLEAMNNREEPGWPLDGKRESNWKRVVHGSLDINPFTRDAARFGASLMDERVSYIRGAFKKSAADSKLTPFFAQVQAVLGNRAGRNIGGLAKAIRLALDEDVRKTAWGTVMTGEKYLSWLSGLPERDGGYALSDLGDPRIVTLQRNRVQAVQLYPAFAGFMSFGSMVKVIDEGLPLRQALSERIGVPLQVIDAMKGRGHRMLNLPHPRHSHDGTLTESLKLFSMIPEIDRSRLPERGPDWSVFMRNLRAVGEYRIENMGAFHDPDEIRENITRNMSRMKAGARRPMKSYHEIETGAFRDMLRDVTTKLLLPMVKESGEDQNFFMLREDMENFIAGEWFSKASFKDLDQASRRWHNRAALIEDQLGTGIYRKFSWMPLLGEMAHGSVAIREIRSQFDLRERGHLEHHCVGGYLPKIRGGGGSFSLIYALDSGNERLSTVEIGAQKNEEKTLFTIRQNHAAWNREPVAEARSAAEALVLRLGDLDEDRIASYRRDFIKDISQQNDDMQQMSTFERSCGVKCSEPDYLARAWTQFEDCLPRSLRRAGITGLQARLLDDVMPKIIRQRSKHATPVWNGPEFEDATPF